MYSKYAQVANLGGYPSTAHQFKLKQHHHIRLDQEFKLDCKIWLEFLPRSLQEVVQRPMIDVLEPTFTSCSISFFSDASKTIGFGVLLNTRWIKGLWDPQFIKEQKPSIAYLELFTLCAGILCWESTHNLTNCRVSIFCNNQAVVGMINSMVSSCKKCMYLLWILVLNGLKFNRRLNALYIDTNSNDLVDALSRNQMDRFCKLGQQMNDEPDQIPSQLWPIMKVWQF